MTWHDYVIGIGQFGFGLALIPSLRGIRKPAPWTCFFTAALLFLFGAVYFDLGLYLATASVYFCGALWVVLLMQQRKRTRVFRMDEHCERHGI